MTRRPLDVRLRVLSRRARRLSWRLFKQHCVTLGSVAVIGALFVLVMSSDSFVSRKDQASTQLATAADRPGAVWPAVQRRSVLFYVVQDQKQLTAISEAVDADREARAAGSSLIDRVVYLIAGTPEEETATIARLNFEAQFIQGSPVDMKVVDMRTRFGP
jgi:hypothetical protein